MSELTVGSLSGLAANSFVIDVASGSQLTQPGMILAVKEVAKTDTFSSSLASGASTDVTDLSITHEVADASNKLLLFASIGNSGTSNNAVNCSFAFAEDGTLINVGDTDGSRSRVTSGVTSAVSNGPGHIGFAFPMMMLHTPGAGSKTYTIKVINSYTGTETVYVNRTGDSTDNTARVRSASNFILMEVAV